MNGIIDKVKSSHLIQAVIAGAVTMIIFAIGYDNETETFRNGLLEALGVVSGLATVAFIFLYYRQKKRMKEEQKLRDEDFKNAQRKYKLINQTHCDRCGKEFESKYDKDIEFDEDKILCKSCVMALEDIQREENMRMQEAAHQQALRDKEDKNRVKCPKCGSTDFLANGKKTSIVKGLAGGYVFGLAGTIAGSLSGNPAKVKITCLNCGKVWKPKKSNAK